MEEEAFGRRSAHVLLPGGADVAVTNANKLLYVHLAADWHLNGRLGAPAGAFAAGLHQVRACAYVTCCLRVMYFAALLLLAGLRCTCMAGWHRCRTASSIVILSTGFRSGLPARCCRSAMARELLWFEGPAKHPRHVHLTLLALCNFSRLSSSRWDSVSLEPGCEMTT